jgi:hypothetical protein
MRQSNAKKELAILYNLRNLEVRNFGLSQGRRAEVWCSLETTTEDRAFVVVGRSSMR